MSGPSSATASANKQMMSASSKKTPKQIAKPARPFANTKLLGNDEGEEKVAAELRNEIKLLEKKC